MKMTQTSSNRGKSTHERFFVITQMAYIYGFVGHGMLAVMFYFLQVPEMVYFNVFISVPFFVTAFVINKRGRHNLAFSLAFIELLFHQVVGGLFIGWDTGFQYWLIYLAGLSFFNPRWSSVSNFLGLGIVIAGFIILYVFGQEGVYSLPAERIFFIHFRDGLQTSS